MQKFDVCFHLSENCSQSHCAERSLGNRSFNKQSRSSRQREALNDTNKFLVFDYKNCSLLVRDTDARCSVALVKFVDLPRHRKQDYKWIESSQRYMSFGKATGRTQTATSDLICAQRRRMPTPLPGALRS